MTKKRTRKMENKNEEDENQNYAHHCHNYSNKKNRNNNSSTSNNCNHCRKNNNSSSNNNRNDNCIDINNNKRNKNRNKKDRNNKKQQGQKQPPPKEDQEVSEAPTFTGGRPGLSVSRVARAEVAARSVGAGRLEEWTHVERTLVIVWARAPTSPREKGLATWGTLFASKTPTQQNVTRTSPPYRPSIIETLQLHGKAAPRQTTVL